MKFSSRSTSVFGVAFVSAGLIAALAGCAGHGNYTSEGITNAQKRVGTIKSATQWDMARQQFLAGDLSKALASVNESISLNPEVAKSHTLRGRILVELGQLETASASFAKALEIDPSFVEAHYYLGIVQERFSDRESALASYQAAANLDPGNAQYTVAAAEMLIDLGRLDDAKGMLEGRKASFSHNAGVRQTLGHIALMQNNPALAVTLFEEARMLAPDEISLLEDLAMAQVGAGKYAEAEYSIRRLLEDSANEKRTDLRHAQARCLMELDRPVEARAILLALSNDASGKNDPGIWSDLGEIAVLLGDMNRVRLVAQRLVAIAPQKATGHMLMAVWQRRQGDATAALASLDKAVTLAGRDPAPLMLRGLVLQQLGRAKEAAASFAEAAALDPGRTSAQRMFAAVSAEQ